MSRRALWIAFALVHVAVLLLGFVLPNQPMGDVYLVYEKWSAAYLNQGFVDPESYSLADTRTYVGLVGLTESWVYPQWAIVPMLAAWAFAWAGGYTVGWAIVVVVLDAMVFAVLVGRGRSRSRVAGAWFWLAAILALGPVGMYRLEGVTAPIAILGCLWLLSRPRVAAVLLALATWIKVWPAALLAAAVIALRRRVVIAAVAVGFSVATLLVVAALGGFAHTFGFVLDQTGRGLQIEAPVSTFYLWQAMLGVEGAWIYYDSDMLTFQVTGANVDAVIAVMTPVLAVAVAVVVVLGALAAWRGVAATRLFPLVAFSLVVTLITLNKVGSPQYMSWLFAPVVVGLVLSRRQWIRPAIGVLVLAALTQWVYPIAYAGLVSVDPAALPVILLTVRNALLVVAWIWSLTALVRACRVPRPAAAPLHPLATS